MTEWVPVDESLPDLFEVVWIYWRDREVLLGFRDDPETNLKNNPDWGWYSFEDEKSKWCRFWMPIKCSPYDKPPDPDAPALEKSGLQIRFNRYPPLAPHGLAYYGNYIVIKEKND